jgi:serine protease AprX
VPEPIRRSAEAVSHDHTNHFLRRERRQLGLLRRELGGEVTGKLDRWLARELIHERREQALAEVLGAPLEEGARPHEVLVNMRSGRRQGPPLRRPDPKRRAAAVADLRRSGELAIARLETDLRERGAEVKAALWITHTAHTVLDSRQLAEIAARGDVFSLTSNKPRLMLSLNASRPLIRATQVQSNLGFDGTGVTVAVLDTGVDAAHPALETAVTGQEDFDGEGIGDMQGHGSHCAGIVASRDERFRGIAPGASILDLKHMNASGSGQGSAALEAIQAAVAAGVPIASNSWGISHADGQWQDPPTAGAPDGSCIFCVAADNASEAGVLFVVAAGNNDDDSCATYDTHIDCPGNARLAITVGGSDDDDDMYSESSVGPTPEGRIKPDLVAPGVDIESVEANTKGFTEKSGTSMATPHVAGVAALMLQKNPALIPAQLKATLVGTAVDIGFAPEEMGAGRVDAIDAVNSA